jgi:CRISPR system Cascade subunit CasE
MGFPLTEAKAGDPDFIRPYRVGAFDSVHERPRTEEQAFLFRVDALMNGRAMIVVQSARRPDWEYAFHNADYLLAGPPEVKEVRHDYQEGQSLLFRVRANPTRRNNATRKREGILTEDKQREWLVRKGQAGGFEVLSMMVTDESFKRATRRHPEGGEDSERMSHLSVRYDGILRVTDAEAFREAIIAGIGSGKAFGFGLLSVAPFRG